MSKVLEYLKGNWFWHSPSLSSQPSILLSWFIPPLSLSSYANRTSTTFDSYLSLTAISNSRLFLLKAWLHHIPHNHQNLFSFWSPFFFSVPLYLSGHLLPIQFTRCLSLSESHFCSIFFLLSFNELQFSFTPFHHSFIIFLNSLFFRLQTWLFLCIYFLFAWIKNLKINETCFEANFFFLSIPFFFSLISSTSFS